MRKNSTNSLSVGWQEHSRVIVGEKPQNRSGMILQRFGMIWAVNSMDAGNKNIQQEDNRKHESNSSTYFGGSNGHFCDDLVFV
jgi:hypothetical protein